MPIVGPLNRNIVPVIGRSSHYDATVLQRPMSIISAIRDDGVSYKELYANEEARQQAIELGKIGWGNGGSLWASTTFSDSEITPYSGASFSFLYSSEDDDFTIGWSHPRYEYNEDDTKHPIWVKVTGYSIVVDVKELVNITKEDAGTGDADSVVFSIVNYGISLDGNYSLYDPDGNVRTKVFYGIIDGQRGWYNKSDLYNLVSGKHNLLSSAHSDTIDAVAEKGDIIVGNSDNKWDKLSRPQKERKYYVLWTDQNEPLKVKWHLVPSAKSIMKNPGNGKLRLVGDREMPGKNMYYGFRPGASGRGWYRIV